MARRHAYLTASILLAAASVALVVAANNFYWGASQTAGGDYYLFQRPVPHPFGPILWAAIKPLVFLTPVVTALAVYRTARSWRAGRAHGVCPRCGYDLRATPGRCPECGAVASAPAAGKGAA
jgi:hypothetical protein